MDQNETSTSVSRHFDPKKTVPLSSEDNGTFPTIPKNFDPPKTPLVPQGKKQTKAGEFTKARIFLFVSLPSLILLFNTNTIIVSITTTMLILLSIGYLFDPVSDLILIHLDTFIVLLGKPFVLLWQFCFVKHRASLGRKIKRHSRLIVDMSALLAVMILLGATTLRPFVTNIAGNINDFFCLSTSISWFACDSGFGVTTLSRGINVRIGLIGDNSQGPFDQTTYNTDEMHVEKLISDENKDACAGQHITLAVVTILSRSIEDPQRSATLGLENLQGSYIAQHTWNATHPAYNICLVIANLGTADTSNRQSTLVRFHPEDYSLPLIMHQLAQFTRTNPSFRGIVGFPYSQQVQEAEYIIGKSYPVLKAIPIVSPSASSNDFSNLSNFYRIVSPDNSQGKILASFFCSHLVQKQSHAIIALLTDTSNAYSHSLKLAFQDSLSCSSAITPIYFNYRDGDAVSIQSAVQQALQQKATLIFFPGYEQDMDTVEQTIHQISPQHASAITIISGDALNNVASTNHYSYSIIYATSFTGPLPKTDSDVQDILKDRFFTQTDEPYQWLPTDILLSHDAVSAFAQVVQNLQIGFTQDDFNTALTSVSFAGMSGHIDFQGNLVNGHQADRETGNVYITCNDHNHITHLVTGYTINNNNLENIEPLSSTSVGMFDLLCS